MEKRYLNTDEIAAYLRISKWTVTRLVNNRRIPFIPFGGGRDRRFDVISINDWMAKGMIDQRSVAADERSPLSESNDTMSVKNRYLTTGELAEVIGKSKWWIYKKIDRRDIPFIPIGHTRLFDFNVIQSWFLADQGGEKNGNL